MLGRLAAGCGRKQFKPAIVFCRMDHLQERVCSSLKVREEQFQKLLVSDSRCEATVLLFCH